MRFSTYVVTQRDGTRIVVKGNLRSKRDAILGQTFLVGLAIESVSVYDTRTITRTKQISIDITGGSYVCTHHQ